MRDPESINANEDTRLIPVWSIMAAAAVFVLVEYYFWLVFPDSQHHLPPLGIRIYLNLSCGVGGALLSDGGLRQQGCAAKGNEFAVLDADLLCDAGRHRRGAVLPAAPARGFAMPGLLHARAKRLPLLPAMQLPADGQLRQLLQNGANDGPVLHAVRARTGTRPDADAAAGAGRVRDFAALCSSAIPRLRIETGAPGHCISLRLTIAVPFLQSSFRLDADLRAYYRRRTTGPRRAEVSARPGGGRGSVSAGDQRH